MQDHVLWWGGIVIAQVIHGARFGVLHGCFEHLRNVFDMDAAEHLTGFDDPARGAVADLGERATAGAVDPRKPEDVEW